MSVLLYEFFRGVGAALKFRCRAKDPVGESKNYFNHCKPDFNILFASYQHYLVVSGKNPCRSLRGAKRRGDLLPGKTPRPALK
jgi:hypothetical protein